MRNEPCHEGYAMNRTPRSPFVTETRLLRWNFVRQQGTFGTSHLLNPGVIQDVNNLTMSRYILSLSVAAALFVGCDGATPLRDALPIETQSSHREFSRPQSAYKASSPLLYVGSYDLGATPLYIYLAQANNPEPLASIAKDIDTVSGLCLDSDGTLYVVNQSDGPGWISEYALGHTKPLRVITKGINTPAYCA